MSSNATSWKDLEHFELLGFQEEVLDKFTNTHSVLIADDMGLGKTVEAIALDWRRRTEGTSFLQPLRERGKVTLAVKTKPTLIVTPMSVASEWEDHYGWMLPHLSVTVLDAKNRTAFLEAIRNRTSDIYIMHWDALRLLVDPKRDPNETMRKTFWFHIIGDEIHRVKNRKAQVTRALKRLKTVYKTGLSGTPADNRPADLWSILNWLYPNNFRSYWNFYRAYVEYEVDPIHGYHKVKGVRNVEHLRKQMRTFYIRRRKEEVAKELPEKYYNEIWVDLSPKQRKAYNDMKRNMLAWVGANEDQPMPAPTAVTRMLRLQQFAVASVDVEGPIKKRQRSKSYDPELVAKFLRVAPADLDFHLKRYPDLQATLPKDRRYHKWLNVEMYKYVLVDPSTKLDVAMELIADSDEPIIFFSWFKSLVNLFGRRLDDAGISHGLLTGDTAQADRGDIVRRFQAGKLKVFAGTIAAGGEGITLHRSSHVVFFDRAWSPSKNRQAEDRAHRIGQKNAVQVTDIMARNTVDLGRVQEIQQKWTWIQMMLGDKTFDYQKAALKAADNEFRISRRK